MQRALGLPKSTRVDSVESTVTLRADHRVTPAPAWVQGPALWVRLADAAWDCGPPSARRTHWCWCQVAMMSYLLLRHQQNPKCADILHLFANFRPYINCIFLHIYFIFCIQSLLHFFHIFAGHIFLMYFAYIFAYCAYFLHIFAYLAYFCIFFCILSVFVAYFDPYWAYCIAYFGK